MYIYRVVGAQKASSASMGDGRWRNFLSCRGTMNQTFLLRDKDELNDSPHTFFISSSAKYASICIQTIFSISCAKSQSDSDDEDITGIADVGNEPAAK